MKQVIVNQGNISIKDVPSPTIEKGKILVKTLSVFPYVKDSFQLEWLKRASESHPIFWGGAEAFSDIHKRRLLSPRLRKKFSKFSSWKVIEPIRSRFEKKSSEKSTLN